MLVVRDHARRLRPGAPRPPQASTGDNLSSLEPHLRQGNSPPPAPGPRPGAGQAGAWTTRKTGCRIRYMFERRSPRPTVTADTPGATSTACSRWSRNRARVRPLLPRPDRPQHRTDAWSPRHGPAPRRAGAFRHLEFGHDDAHGRGAPDYPQRRRRHIGRFRDARSRRSGDRGDEHLEPTSTNRGGRTWRFIAESTAASARGNVGRVPDATAVLPDLGQGETQLTERRDLPIGIQDRPGQLRHSPGPGPGPDRVGAAGDR